MKQNYLLPHKFKKAGTIMFLPFLAVCVWLLLGPGECDYLKVPVFALFEDGYLFSTKSLTSTITDPINEIAMLGLLISIVFIALSKEKDEDEMVPVERQSAFIWSFWVTAALYSIGILFTFGMQFLNCTFAMPYVFFILYIIKFNLAMHKLRRELK